MNDWAHCEIINFKSMRRTQFSMNQCAVWYESCNSAAAIWSSSSKNRYYVLRVTINRTYPPLLTDNQFSHPFIKVDERLKIKQFVNGLFRNLKINVNFLIIVAIARMILSLFILKTIIYYSKYIFKNLKK